MPAIKIVNYLSWEVLNPNVLPVKARIFPGSCPPAVLYPNLQVLEVKPRSVHLHLHPLAAPALPAIVLHAGLDNI